MAIASTLIYQDRNHSIFAKICIKLHILITLRQLIFSSNVLVRIPCITKEDILWSPRSENSETTAFEIFIVHSDAIFYVLLTGAQSFLVGILILMWSVIALLHQTTAPNVLLPRCLLP